MNLACLAIALATLASAQPAPPPLAHSAAPTSDAAGLEAAMAMLKAQDFESQILSSTEVMVEGMLAAQIEQLQKAEGEQLPDDLLKSFSETMRSHATATMKAKMPRITRQSAEIYAREFTPAELRRMAEIAGDPVMIKSRTKGQALSSQLMMVGMNAMRESQDELKQKLDQVVADYVKRAGLAADEDS